MAATDKKILLCWIGLTDLAAVEGKVKGIGPIAQAITERDYDQVILLSNFSKTDTSSFATWLSGHSSTQINSHFFKLTTPTNFGEIYEAVVNVIKSLLEEYGCNTKLTYHTSPGTPAMAAVWIIVAKTRFAAELLESSLEGGVKTAVIPFDIYAELIPDLFKRPDRDLEKLTTGEPTVSPAFSDIICRSTSMKRAIAMAQRIAPRSIPVLIEGESGTGKELMARAIHKASTRRDGPFIAVNCGAISPDLIESEFFGHKKGSFTGAASDRKGHFEEASGGTLFLDEIGEMPLTMQVKLLRAIQEKKIVRLGTSDEISVDIRIVAATNRTLAKEVSEGRFREDLFYRIAVGMVRLPPLRSRSGDLALLVDHLLEIINKESAAEPDWKQKNISPSARNLLSKHTWPGNIRELQNTLSRAVAWSSGGTISKEDMQEALLEMPAKESSDDGILNKEIDQGIDLPRIMAEVVRHYITRTLKETGGHKSKTAELLGLGSYQTLKNWIKKYRVDI